MSKSYSYLDIKMLRATKRTATDNNPGGGFYRGAMLSVIAHGLALLALTFEISFPSPVTHLDTFEVEVVLEDPEPEKELDKERILDEARLEQDENVDEAAEEKPQTTTLTEKRNEARSLTLQPRADDLPAGAVAPGQTDAETEQKERPEPPQPRPALRQLAKLANLVDQEKSSAQQVLALDTVPGCTGDVPTSTSSHIDRMAQSAKTGRSYAQAAVNAQVGGYIRKAIDLYDTAILAGDLSRNNLAKVYNNRGAAYRILGFSGLAIDDYNEAMRLKPNYAAAYFNRGVAYRLNNKQKLAIKDFTRSIQLDSGFADPFVQRGMTYAQEGAHKRAISDFSRAIQLAPCLASAYFNRGRMFESLGHLERAIDDFRKSYSLSPNSKKFKEKLLSLTAP